MQKLNTNTVAINSFSTASLVYTLEKGSEIISAAQKWMNVSFPNGKILYSIERVIANQFFSATGTETERTRVGRFKPGLDEIWSVVAINNLISYWLKNSEICVNLLSQ